MFYRFSGCCVTKKGVGMREYCQIGIIVSGHVEIRGFMIARIYNEIVAHLGNVANSNYCTRY